MLPLLIIGGVILGVIVISAILSGPTKENDTVSEIQARLEREKELAAQKKKNDEEARVIKQERKRLKEDMRRMARAAEERRRLDQEEARAEQQRVSQAQQAAEEEEEEQRKREHDQLIARQIVEEQNQKLLVKLDRIKARELRLQQEVDKANKLAAAAAAAAPETGPHRWPTREEFQSALMSTQYHNDNFHFAIVGRAGSGKSSLINAFRNLRNRDPGAADTGTTETTLEIGRYPDPGDQPPRKWMVWFDVPGAGTQRIPHSEYFIKQGLFVFDFIIVAVGDRFEEIDVRILDDARRFKIPTFVVRSKADMHILNEMKGFREYHSIEDDPKCYRKCRDEFIRKTMQTVGEELARAGLPDQRVYIVSRDILQQTYNSSLSRPTITFGEHVNSAVGWIKLPKNGIHESHLVKDLLTAASQRRCDPEQGQRFDMEASLDWVKDAYSTVKESIKPRSTREPPQKSDLVGFFPVPQVHDQPQTAAHHGQLTAAQTPNPPKKKQPPSQYIRKVTYPPHPTTAQELYDEMAKRDPDLPNMLVGLPQMFKPRVAMLTFYPLAPVPRAISAFGTTMPVVEYRERESGEGKGKGKDGAKDEENTAGTRGGRYQRGGSKPPPGTFRQETRGSTRGGATRDSMVRRGSGRGGYRGRGSPIARSEDWDVVGEAHFAGPDEWGGDWANDPAPSAQLDQYAPPDPKPGWY